MILELILAACIGQVQTPPGLTKQPPVAPIDEVQVVVEKVVDTQKVNELQKKVKDLQSQLDKLLREKQADPIKSFKFVMSDKRGRKFGNNSYERLVQDINRMNAEQEENVPVQNTGSVFELPLFHQLIPQPGFNIPTTVPRMQMGIGAAAASCSPGGT